MLLLLLKRLRQLQQQQVIRKRREPVLPPRIRVGGGRGADRGPEVRQGGARADLQQLEIRLLLCLALAVSALPSGATVVLSRSWHEFPGFVAAIGRYVSTTYCGLSEILLSGEQDSSRVFGKVPLPRSG